MDDASLRDTPTAVPLDRWERIAAGAVGVAFGITGIIAVFATDNEAGSTALLAIGALLTIIMVSGHVPQKLKFGDNEIALGLRRAARAALEESQPSVRAQVAEAIKEAGLPERDPLAVAANAVLLELDVLSSLQDVVRPVPGPPLGLDAVVERRGKRVGIEIKMVVGLTGTGRSRQLIERLAESARRQHLAGVVLVIGRPAPVPVLAQWIDTAAEMDLALRVVPYGSADFKAQLEFAIEDLTR